MPNFSGQFFSIVIVGKHNPQILNHNFLINNEILPVTEEPFKSLLAKEGENPFTEFVSTPVLATIKYGSISMVIEESRYQIKDSNYGDPATSSIVNITKKYFGEILKYTPISVGGINLSGNITFDDEKDEQGFNERFGVNIDTLCTHAGTQNIRLGMNLAFLWLEGLVDVQIPRLKGAPNSRKINFNYEFKYNKTKDFFGNLDKVNQISEKFRELLKSLGVEESV